METGKIVFLLGVVVLSVMIGSTVGYRIGHASGVIETTIKIEKQQLDTESAAVSQASAPYSSVPTNPLQDVQTNPFNY